MAAVLLFFSMSQSISLSNREAAILVTGLLTTHTRADLAQANIFVTDYTELSLEGK